jgi:hypothetical protein
MMEEFMNEEQENHLEILDNDPIAKLRARELDLRAHGKC